MNIFNNHQQINLFFAKPIQLKPEAQTGEEKVTKVKGDLPIGIAMRKVGKGR